jgi:subtilisin family serine protease
MLMMGCAPTLTPIAITETPKEENRVLVTFVDREIGRSLPANPQDRYQARGLYENTSWSQRLAEELAQRYRLRYLAAWPITELGESCVVYAVPPELSLETTITNLKRDPRVASAQTMRTFRVTGQMTPGAANYADPYFKLQKNVDSMRISEAHRLSTGRGVRIAVIDSGIDRDHPDLSGKVVFAENLARRAADEREDDIHGTAVAGVLAAKPGNGVGIVGVSPDAELLGFRACWPERPGMAEAVCNSFTLALAVNEAIRHQADIINLSLTGPEDPLLARLLTRASDHGILVVAADAGQGGFPAGQHGVVAVRASKSTPSNQVGLSNELSAPGTGILTTLPPARYGFMSGSSFAAPHIAGLLALMKEVKPDLTEAEALPILHSSEQGDSMGIDACRSLARLNRKQDC